MARFLFVVPPLTGHVNPTVSTGQALMDRGHEVAWLAHPGKVRPLLMPGAQLIEMDDQVPEALVAAMREKAQSVRGLAALKFLWEDFIIPLAHAMIPHVEAAVARYKPDAMMVDQQALAGMVVARKRQLPWATSATTSAGVTDPLKGLPKVAEWLQGQLTGLQVDSGLKPLPAADCSPHAVIVFSTTALVGRDDFPGHFHFVGPSIRARSDQAEFPWEALDPKRKRVFISLGSVNADRGARFYAVAREAFADSDLQIILAAPDDQAAQMPDNFIVRSWVPQLELLGRVDAVVSHAGHNTVCETLAHGLPLVVAPIKDDQPVVAQQVVDAGAGVRIRFGRPSAKKLRAAVMTILGEPEYRAAATRIQASFDRAGGSDAAADVLEELLR